MSTSRPLTALAASTALAIGFFASPGAPGAAPGEAVMSFLKIGVGARAEGMGGAYAAHADDATAVYWNPAGLVSAGSLRADLSHLEWLQDVRYEHLAIAGAKDGRAWGASVSGIWMDELEKRDVFGNEQGTFRFWDFSGSLAYAQRVTDRVDAGVAVKLLREVIDDVTASGWAADAGVIVRLPLEGATAAATALHVGPDVSYENGSFRLPSAYRLGAAYRRSFGVIHAVGAWDLALPSDEDAQNHFGAECEYDRTVALRVGYRTGHDTQDLSFGLGLLATRGIRVDYANAALSDDLGSTHRFSLSRTW